MRRFTLLLLAFAFSSHGAAAEPKPIANPDQFCEKARELKSITSQLPDYALSWEAESPVVVLPPLKFNPVRLLKAAHGQPVCIAVVVDETGIALDASVYFPKRFALTKIERSQVLANKFEPAKKSGLPIRSIMVMKAWLQ
mgnify:CR=1 FL=1